MDTGLNVDLERLLERFDVTIHVTCDIYSSRSQIAEFPSFTRHHIGALYCWLLWLPEDRWLRLIDEYKKLGFHKAVILSFDQASAKETKLTFQIREFLPRLAGIHGRGAIELVQSARDQGFKREVSRFVFDLFDKTQTSIGERAMWGSVLDALEGVVG